MKTARPAAYAWWKDTAALIFSILGRVLLLFFVVTMIALEVNTQISALQLIQPSTELWVVVVVVAGLLWLLNRSFGECSAR